jgi:hypothetical protein
VTTPAGPQESPATDAADLLRREQEIRAGLESLRRTRGWDQQLLKAVVTTLIVADLPDEERHAFFAQLLDQALAKLGEGDRVAAIEIADSQGGLSALRFIMNRRADDERTAKAARPGG